MLREYDRVIDTISKKTGTIVYITDGNFEKGIVKEYLFEPDDHSFDPVFRSYEQLSKLTEHTREKSKGWF